MSNEQNNNVENELLLKMFKKIGDNEKNIKQIDDQEWDRLYAEFELLESTKTNKIPRSVFEEKYSIFFNKENANSFNYNSEQAELWRERSNEFIKLIDPYKPFYVVDDYDTDKIYLTFPPIFRKIDTLNKPIGAALMDVDGEMMDSSEVYNVVHNVFDKYSHHQIEKYRVEGAKLLNKCIVGAQDKDRLLEDIKNTDKIIEKFNRDINPSNVNTDDEELSAEDAGISFE